MEPEMRECVESAFKIVKELTNTKSEEKSSILDSDACKIRLLFTTHLQDTRNRSKTNTIKIAVPHPVIKKSDELCLFVGDGKKSGQTATRENILLKVEEIQEKLTSAGIDQVTQIIPLLKLKLEFKEFEARRNLSKGYDLFLAEDRVIRLLPDLLGKPFYGAKKYKVPVQVRTGRLVADLKNILTNTFCYFSNAGNSHSVVIGDMDMSVDQLTENFQAVLKRLAQTVPGGALNIKAVHVKGNSKAVPVFLNKEVDLDSLKKLMKENSARVTQKRSIEENPEDLDLTTINGLVKLSRDGTININKTDGTKIRITADGCTDRNAHERKRVKKEVKTPQSIEETKLKMPKRVEESSESHEQRNETNEHKSPKHPQKSKPNKAGRKSRRKMLESSVSDFVMKSSEANSIEEISRIEKNEECGGIVSEFSGQQTSTRKTGVSTRHTKKDEVKKVKTSSHPKPSRKKQITPKVKKPKSLK